MTVDLGGHRQVSILSHARRSRITKHHEHFQIIIELSDKKNSCALLQARRVWRDYCMDVQVGRVSIQRQKHFVIMFICIGYCNNKISHTSKDKKIVCFQGLVFLVDVSDRVRLDEARGELAGWF